MKLVRTAAALAAATALAFSAAPAFTADAAPVTAAQVAGNAPVGTVKNWNAHPAPTAVTTGETAKWVGQVDHQNVWAFWVSSPSMGRDIPVAVIPARNGKGEPVKNAPTIYLLNGAGGAEQDADWLTYAETAKFYKDKGVNVVIPMEGAFSYYTDWLNTPKAAYFKGPQKWETFLTKELPGPIEKRLGADNRRAIVGFSMSATSSLLLAEHYPDKFDAVGSFSGCAATSTPLPWAFSALTVNRAAKQPDYTSITPAHIWGPMGSPYNRYNDALVNAEKLRGKAIYISNGSGTGSQTDMVGFRTAHGQSLPEAISGAMTTTVEGGVIEAATNSCTHDLRAKLNSKNIPAHYELRKAGTHAWPVWIDDMYRSWNTTIGPALVGENFVRAEPSTALPERATWNGSSN